MTIKINQFPQMSNLALKIKKQILKICKDSKHNKKNKYLDLNEKKIYQISKVSKNHLYLSDLITNLNPDEIVSILSQYAQLAIKEVSPYKYQAQYQQQVIDFAFDEETEEIFEIQKEITIEIMFEIKQISECSDQFTIQFKNLSKQYDIGYQNLKSDLNQYLISF